MRQYENPHVGYVLKRYPRYSETFVVNEILAHEAANLPLDIFSIRPVAETHFQDVLGLVRSPVSYIPENLRNVPEFWKLVVEARDRLPGFWEAFRNVDDPHGANVAQAIQVALTAQQKGITHLHAHFGTVATTVARLAASFADITYSFTAHAKDIYFRYEKPVDLGPKMRDAVGVVTVSNYNLAHLREHYGDDATRVVRIYNGLDVSRFDYTAPRARPPEILAVGRLIDKKGFHVLIEAARILRGRGLAFTCRIIGDGIERDNLAAQIERAGLADAVILVGPRPQADVHDAMRSAAVLAAPCVVSDDGNRDGLPTVLLEAMALGTPCVSTDVTGIPELIRDGETGLCVGEGDPDQLADALARLLSNESQRVRLAESARRLIELEFDIRRNAAELRNLFQAASAEAGKWRGAAA